MSIQAPIDERTNARAPLAQPAARYRVVPAGTASRSRLNNAVVFALVALTIGAVGLLYLVQTSRVASLGYEASRLQREREAAALRNEQLSYEVARYQSLPMVERVALEQLNMQPMEEYIFLTVPRPEQAELVLPEPEATAEPSVWGRVWNRLMGEDSATHQQAEASP